MSHHRPPGRVYLSEAAKRELLRQRMHSAWKWALILVAAAVLLCSLGFVVGVLGGAW